MSIRDILPFNSRGTGLSVNDNTDERGRSPFLALHREIEDVFDRFWERFNLPPTGGRSLAGLSSPAVDIAETEKGLEISAELPGLDRDDIEISVTDDSLILRGEKKNEYEDTSDGRYYSERTYGAFYRTIPLPAGFDSEQAEANFRNGVVTVFLPASAEKQKNVRKIDVKAA